MTNDYASVETSGNDMMDEEQGEPVPCVHIYAMSDGSYGIEQSSAPAPADLESAPDLRAAMMRAEEMLTGDPEAEDQAMASAQAGYARRAKPPMPKAAPRPGAIFGE